VKQTTRSQNKIKGGLVLLNEWQKHNCGAIKERNVADEGMKLMAKATAIKN